LRKTVLLVGLLLAFLIPTSLLTKNVSAQSVDMSIQSGCNPSSKTVMLTFDNIVQLGLLVDVRGSGTTNATGTSFYSAGTVVWVKATPLSGWIFVGWLLNGTNVGSANPCSLNMNANYNLTAVFNPIVSDTQVNFTFSPNPAKLGDTVVLSGKLTDKSGNPVYPASVVVDYSMNGGPWIYYATLYTNSTGGFSQIIPPPPVGTYLVNASFGSSGGYNPSSQTVVLTVQQQPQTGTWVYFNFVPNPTTPGSSVNLKGILVGDSGNPLGSANVKVEYSTNDGTSWSYIWTLTTNQFGIFSQGFAAPGSGRYLVRVSYSGDATHKSCSNNAYLMVLSPTLGVTAAGNIIFNFNPNPVALGSSATLRGILLDASNKPIASATVKVDYSTDNGASWNYIWTLTTNQYGIFSQTFTTLSTGTYLVRLSYAGQNVTTYFVTR
jgi:hypothetical protein